MVGGQGEEEEKFFGMERKDKTFERGCFYAVVVVRTVTIIGGG